MKERNKTVFWFIVVVTLLSFLVALPGRFEKEISWRGKKHKIAFHRPDLDFKIGPLKISRPLYLHRGMDIAGGVHFVFRAKMDKIPGEDRDKALESLRENIQRRVNLFGVSESSVWVTKNLDEYHLIVEIPGDVDPKQAASLIGQTAQLDFRLEETLPPEATATATIYDLFAKETGLTGAHLKRATVEFDPNTGKPQVGLEFNEEGKKIFARITKENVGKRMAIFLDMFPLSAPVIKEPILNGKAVISGDFTLEQAKRMVSQLNAGALPVEIEMVQQQKIAPTLGSDSIRRGVMAGLVGVALVAFFMIANYGFLGVLAVVGLVIYGIISLALYKLIPVTLTMSGISGFLLSLGMAVDSNILIFERMKEELWAGKPWKVAMELGFGRAWDSIKDANICTLIICFILFNPFNWSFLNTSGMVRGFALTLGLGVILEIFTGIVVVRTLIRTFYRGEKEK